jgi:hypothetical protein
MQTVSSINHIIDEWPNRSRRVVDVLVNKYGLPHEATDSLLIWHYNGVWKRTILHRDGTPHNFPRPHMDVLEQTIDYRVPLGKYNELAEFDGSIMIDRTRGEISAHCDSEAMNTIMLNLAHDIVIGKRSVEDARRECAKIVANARLRWPSTYSRELRFSPGIVTEREGDTPDPDKRVNVGVLEYIS